MRHLIERDVNNKLVR